MHHELAINLKQYLICLIDLKLEKMSDIMELCWFDCTNLTVVFVKSLPKERVFFTKILVLRGEWTPVRLLDAWNWLVIDSIGRERFLSNLSFHYLALKIIWFPILWCNAVEITEQNDAIRSLLLNKLNSLRLLMDIWCPERLPEPPKCVELFNIHRQDIAQRLNNVAGCPMRLEWSVSG